ncbi:MULTISPECIES: methyltransferase domain-containing protein [unclassified Streptomyces]|uniref:methyltransferase domain-containing protein n=1 Tax=unclassified Streptomyces TaxID=2593676 RepID=UPI002E813D76|nr:methyltransferase domain-containing protein [Streptomyces sp. NBC_00589]WTI41711.1 methyltransferase domain-containing protein [Streptomyces sp. NBC_00775]WUB24606.1 methyltransferase domain-containing protein [Streptomyces sp. NBC_00589]
MGDTRPTSDFHAQNFTAESVARLVGALDAQDANDGVRRLRAWAHEALAARPGERALDIGSGSGSQTRHLAAAVTPGGEVLGIEPNPGLRAVAEQRAAEAGSPARFVDGDALTLPVPDSSVDVVWCERVLQHLLEPEKAVAEIARVLRPGGRVALLDTDWATTILHPGDPETVAALTSGALSAAADPYSGRKLVGRLTAAGLVIDDRGSQALLQDHTSVAWPLIRMLGESALRRALITEGQRDRLYADLTEAAAQGALHMSVTMFGAVAHCPE